MAPKHGLSGLQAEETLVKRAKNSETPASRSSTPAEQTVRVSYEVLYPPVKSSKKKLTKREQDLLDHAEHHESPFTAKGARNERELDRDYTVVPSKEWEAMRKYNNFVIQGETYKNNHFVYVKSEGTPKNTVGEEPKDFWVARILQVRAKNPQHVYALVAWMYWSEELPAPNPRAPDQISPSSGKRTYHGSHELIASNHLEVLDVLSFAGKAEVHHWLEEDDNLQHKLYWRQTYNPETQELSKIREHCICGGHFNPEVAMEICENPACKAWLHEQCIIDDVLTRTCKRLLEDSGSTEPDTNGAGSKANGKKGKAERKIWEGKFKAKINAEEPTTITITDLRPDITGPKTWTERISCLKCSTLLQ